MATYGCLPCKVACNLEAVDGETSRKRVVVARGRRHRPETGNDLSLTEDPPQHPVQRRCVDGFDQLQDGPPSLL